jgi:hypothetical protein
MFDSSLLLVVRLLVKKGRGQKAGGRRQEALKKAKDRRQQ